MMPSDRSPVHMTYEQGWRKVWETVDTGTLIASYSAGNNAEVTAKILYQLKRLLTSAMIGRWTVVASCGKAGGASLVASTDDNWLSWADLQVGTGSASHRSWLVLRSPTTPRGTFYFMIDWWVSNASYPNNGNYYFSKFPPDLTGLVTDARPVATGPEWSHSPAAILTNSVVGAVRSYMTVAHDGSFVYSSATPFNDGNWHWFKNGLLFNILQANSCPPWDTTQAVSTTWTGDISSLTDLEYKSLHLDGTQVSLRHVQGFKILQRSYLEAVHTDDYRDKYVAFPAYLVSLTTDKKAWRGILEDLTLPPLKIYPGQPVYKNGVLKAIRVGSWLVPVTRNLVLI